MSRASDISAADRAILDAAPRIDAMTASLTDAPAAREGKAAGPLTVEQIHARLAELDALMRPLEDEQRALILQLPVLDMFGQPWTPEHRLEISRYRPMAWDLAGSDAIAHRRPGAFSRFVGWFRPRRARFGIAGRVSHDPR
jgi:hypothetical protein